MSSRVALYCLVGTAHVYHTLLFSLVKVPVASFALTPLSSSTPPYSPSSSHSSPSPYSLIHHPTSLHQISYSYQRGQQRTSD
ncbi:hypothetical protein EVAR_26654_1 [Eumeta japonica]|uniref:Uncharacterized protein n=1 Tax=Eumeta variegata TaxID=151549 RepID=A0A4C1VMD7_EUMVA|nr:hypothetical protein EVAR_26654_1 [Eumeta japonica]